MNPVLNRNLFFVKEQISRFKASNNYDILDPENQKLLLTTREEIKFFAKLLRFSSLSSFTPFNLIVKTEDEQQVIRIKRGASMWRSKISIFDENDNLVGSLKERIATIDKEFVVLDANNQELCKLIGEYRTWNYKFVKNDTEFAFITKKWAGVGRELFSSADNYMMSIDESVPKDNPMRMLILASAMCIDKVFHEKS